MKTTPRVIHPLLFFAVFMISPVCLQAAAPPGIDPTDPFVIKGYLPVTLYGALPDDAVDDTAQIQQAIDEALEYGYVAFFPGGTYHVSTMLRAMQRVTPSEKDPCKFKSNRRMANVLVGSTAASRPVLKLVGDGTEFKDANNPRPLIWFWSQPRNLKPDGGEALPCEGLGSTDPEHEQSNINMDQVFRGIDIDISGGYEGAIGIRHAGSQGSYIENVNINATDAFAGIYNAPGQGGGTLNVTVSGGQYGFIGNKVARYPVLAGVRFLDQTTAAFHWDGQHNLTIVGFEIRSSSTTAAVTLQTGRKPQNGVALVDGTIEANGFTAIDNLAGRDLHLKDVYVRGTANIMQNGTGNLIPGGLTEWQKVNEYVYTASTSRSFIDGELKSAGYENSDVDQTAGIQPPDDLVLKHVPADTIPGFEDPETISITDYGANGEDDLDDTQAIKLALANHQKVLFPKGEYLISEPLTLGPNQHLFGSAKTISLIKSAKGWHPTGRTPMIMTVADEDATTSLSSVGLQARKNPDQLTHLLWRAGRNSIIKDIMISRKEGGNANIKHESFAFEDQAGGRVYGLSGEWSSIRALTFDPNYRHLRVTNTRQPLAFYGLNIERSHNNPQSEINGSTNIQIYSLKGEANEDIDVPGATVLRIVNSGNISGFGYSGIASPASGRGLIEFINSDHVQFSNIAHVLPSETPITIKESYAGTTKQVSGRHPLALFKRGMPQLDAVDTPPPPPPPPPPLNEELLSNPGFENNLTGWTRNSVTSPVVVSYASNIYEGTKAAKLEPKNSWQALVQKANVEPQKSYKISAAMKTRALSEREFKASIVVKFFNDANSELSRTTLGSVKNASRNYKVYSKTLVAPQDADYLQLRLTLSNGKQAKVFFDAASVMPVD